MTLTRVRHKLADLTAATDALVELAAPFTTEATPFHPYCVEVQPVRIPPASRRLLAPREHMTEVLQHHHEAWVDVHVCHEKLEGESYSRIITLTPEGQANKIVECGIV